LPPEEGDMVVMSYNVRLFNLFQWIPGNDVHEKIKNFINEINPDILCVQEYSENAGVDLRVYKYRTLFMQGNKIKTGQAIFSKYPIIDEGQITFESSHNMLIYADIRKGQDTLRVYIWNRLKYRPM
jgi:exonuclease III